MLSNGRRGQFNLEGMQLRNVLWGPKSYGLNRDLPKPMNYFISEREHLRSLKNEVTKIHSRKQKRTKEQKPPAKILHKKDTFTIIASKL